MHKCMMLLLAAILILAPSAYADCKITINPVTGLFDCSTAAGASTGINNPGVNGIVVCTGTNCSTSTAGNLSGDVTSSGLATTIAAGAVTTAKIGNNQVDMATKMTGTMLAAQFPALTGDVTTSAGSLITTIANGAVTLAKVSGATGSGLFVFQTTPTIITPTIASFVNANHNHSNAAGGGTLAATALPVFVASGASHAVGAVPDPGASAGTTRFLREDATWQVPSGVGGGYNLIQNNGVPLAAQTTLNFVNGGCVNNSGAGSTDCTFTGGGASNYNSLSNWLPVRTSTTVLTFGVFSSGSPGILAQGNKTANFTASPTLTITGGTGTAAVGADYSGASPVLTAYLNGITATWANCSGCTTTTGASVPDDILHQPIASWSAAVSTVWDVNGLTDYRPQGIRKDIYQPGFGMGTFTVSNGKVTIPFDPTQLVVMCEYQFGDGTNAVTSGETPGLRLCLNKTGRTVNILGASCWVDNASATTTVRPIKSGGATNSILSTTMSCSNTTPTGSTGTLNGSPTLADGEAIDFTNITPDTVTKQGVMRVWLTM